MTFDIRALGFNAAKQIVRVEGLTEIRGRKAWRISSFLRTYPSVEIFYKMHDESTTWLDAETFQVLQVVSKQEEGDWKNEAFITNYPERGVVHYRDKRGFKQLYYKPPVLDLIGMIYYGRTLELELKKKYSFNIIDGPNLRNISATVTAKEKNKRVSSYSSEKISLIVMNQDANPDVAVWFTDDEKKVPVRIRTMKIRLVGIDLGNIESVLIKYKEKKDK